ncbi:PREDICTED: uncharacterized protein LOC104783595 [Camelina sativa]|uniref:Uncharacterized protein LOC104783595 n=1 Tax=Camelina sativa TaxID=90675 RepID=A0ABM0YWS8_CAMSA|nr:PREDICTED: uncharacterized protein LOC104783595 [Camelina sativa]
MLQSLVLYEIFPPLRPHQKVDEEDGEKKKEEEPLKSDFSTKKETESKDEKKQAPRAKKAQATKPQEEPDYFEEKRNLQDLWKAAVLVGIEWKLLDAIYEHIWDFKHLEEALEEGRILYGKNVYVFVNADLSFLKEQVREAKKARQDATTARMQAIEDMSQDDREIFPPLRPHQKVDEEDGEKKKEEEPLKSDFSTKKETESKDEKKQAPRAKKAQATKPQEEPDYFEEKRNLQDLWKAAVLVGIEWKLLDAIYEHIWDFKHLEEALEEGRILYGKNVYVFVNADLSFLKEQVREAKKARQDATTARMQAIEDMSQDDRANLSKH